MAHELSDEVRYRILNLVAEHPEISQRQLANELGISVGKVNYCLRALIDKGLVKMRNFRKSKHKLGYAYVITPRGLEEKVSVAYAFLRRKMAEYDALHKEIELLTAELNRLGVRQEPVE